MSSQFFPWQKTLLHSLGLFLEVLIRYTKKRLLVLSKYEIIMVKDLLLLSILGEYKSLLELGY